MGNESHIDLEKQQWDGEVKSPAKLQDGETSHVSYIFSSALQPMDQY